LRPKALACKYAVAVGEFNQTSRPEKENCMRRRDPAAQRYAAMVTPVVSGDQAGEQLRSLQHLLLGLQSGGHSGQQPGTHAGSSLQQQQPPETAPALTRLVVEQAVRPTMGIAASSIHT
jgi:hypothetical protein